MKKTILNKILVIKKAFFNSKEGIAYLIQERAFRQEIILGIFLLACEILRHGNEIIRMYLLISYVIVLITESLNTAIESVIDRISLQKHELSKRAKDIGSAAVFISLLHLGIVWILSWFL